MCIGGGTPSMPPPPATTPRYAAPRAPEVEAEQARSDEALRRRAAANLSGTILTGPQGLTTAASTTGKTVLGG